MTHRHRQAITPRSPSSTSLWWTLILGLVIALPAVTGGCGGGDKRAREPEPVEPVDEVEEEPEPIQIPAEKYDEIARFFKRKNKFLNTCFTSAISAGEISKRGRARIAITLTITTQGKMKNPKVDSMEPDSPTLRDCIFEKMQRWTATTLPKPLEYSYTFGFDTL